ncbi:hypothetical protein HK405_001520, partial [Cladochytrium tenue]
CTFPIGLAAIYYAAKVNQPAPPPPQSARIDATRAASDRDAATRRRQHLAAVARTLTAVTAVGTALAWVVVLLVFLQLFRP